jgi:phosphate transport system substrate-binding protein
LSFRNLPDLKQPLKLDGAALADIFLGKIKKWDDPKIAVLNAGVKLPSLPVTVARRSDGSGTSFIFTSYLSAVSSEWKTKVGTGKSVSWPAGIGGKGNSGVAGIIKQSPGAVGYVELAYAEQNKLQYASMRNKAGKFIAPTVEATTAAAAGSASALQKDVRASIINAAGEASYPIASFTYLLVYEDTGNAEKAEALKAFLDWAVTDGQKMAKDLAYAPLPDAVVKIDEEKIAKIH